MTTSKPHRWTTRAAVGWLVGLLALAACSSSNGSRTPPAAGQSSASGIAASSAGAGLSSASATPDASSTSGSLPVQPAPTATSSSPAATTVATLAGFQPASVTFVSPGAGFVLGTQACATGTCTTLGATADAGRTWAKVGVLPPALTGDTQGVRKLRFATASDGWAFGPQLWSTHDGGRSWRQIPEPGPVSDVEASGGVAYAIVASCAAEPCGGGVRLLRTPVDADTWTAVAGVALQNDGRIALHGRAVWVVAAGGPGAAKFVTSADGASWHFVADPCATLGPNWGLGGVAPVTTTSVYLLCTSSPGAGSEAKKVLFSTDSGAHGTPTSADPPTGGLADGIAAASTAIVVLPARSGASWVYRSANGGHSWATPLTQGDGGMGYGDVGFTTATQGVAIHGSPSASDPSALFMTRDAGATWAPVTF